ncbi:hypothetical protein AX774_g8047 [Zancudomyces culisetae]|uniref:Uncharacterized protein n=1 Tax=Zancudomyces culisetae TaxID=1213189 RepID=A0A1R1PC63_ZANCU|nr:hypothetical protein AX774_g8047 [Zancudomyces culisetae]|eukprot:OMH78558.1 hypothetical protein AX774_g8047 [Zancudomyces culisetae]
MVLLASEEYKNHKKGEFLVPKLENIISTNNSVNHKVVFDYHQPNIVERPLTRTLDNGFGCNYVMGTEIETLDLHNLDEPKHPSTSIGVSSDLRISKNNTDSFRKNTTTQKNSAIFDPFSFDDDLGGKYST